MPAVDFLSIIQQLINTHSSFFGVSSLSVPLGRDSNQQSPQLPLMINSTPNGSIPHTHWNLTFHTVTPCSQWKTHSTFQPLALIYHNGMNVWLYMAKSCLEMMKQRAFDEMVEKYPISSGRQTTARDENIQNMVTLSPWMILWQRNIQLWQKGNNRMGILHFPITWVYRGLSEVP